MTRSTRPLALLASLVMTSASSAEPLVHFDVSFTRADAGNSRPSRSHHDVGGAAIDPGRPRDRTHPSVYLNGAAHNRGEVIEEEAGASPPPGPLPHPEAGPSEWPRLHRHRRLPWAGRGPGRPGERLSGIEDG